VLFDKLDTAKMHGLDKSNVSSQDVTSQVEFGLIAIRDRASLRGATHRSAMLAGATASM